MARNKSKYDDRRATMQVLGAIYNNPKILEDERYRFVEEDFTEDFHKVLFESMYNLYAYGAKEITDNAIEDYLSSRPAKMAVYKRDNGREYLEKLLESLQIAAFPYYYDRVKKMTLLRMYEKSGLDMSFIYDPDNILDAKMKQQQEDSLDNTSLAEIAEIVENKFSRIKSIYAEMGDEDIKPMDYGLDELLDRLGEKPDLGYPLYGNFINTMCRGARLSKFYCRSAATNVGKSRAMVADAATIGYGYRYDTAQKKWINTGKPEHVLFMGAEQGIDEIQTAMLAFLTGIDEEKINTSDLTEEERGRIYYAREIMRDGVGKIHFVQDPSFTLQTIEKHIKSAIRDYNVQYVFFDYLHETPGLTADVGNSCGKVAIRQDSVLFLMSTKLKELAVKYNIFIMTSTQLNAEYKAANVYDQNLLRGAKSIADKIDFGTILLEVDEKDVKALTPLCKKSGIPVPNLKMAVYKNRATKWKNILVWMNADRSCCRYDPVFVTDYNYQLLDIADYRAIIEDAPELRLF